MIIYLFVFLTSIIFLYNSNLKCSKYKTGLIVGAVLLLALVAGLRSENVGVDVKVYAIPYYKLASQSTSLGDLFNYMKMYYSTDVGFHMVNYLASRITDDYHLGLFIYELMFIIFSYLGIREFEKKSSTPVWLAMLFLLFSLYNPSLNIMRQCIAVSILFYGIACYLNSKKVHYLIAQLIAFSFHSSSIIGIGIIVLFHLLSFKHNQTVNKQMMHGGGLILCGIVFLCMIPSVVNVLVEMGLLHQNFLLYLPGGIYSNIGSGDLINPLSVMPSLFYFGLVAIHYKSLMNEKYEGLFMLFCCLIVFAIDFGPLVAEYITRIGYYFIPFQCVALANVSNVCVAKYRKWYIAMVIAAMIVVWIVTICILGYHGTVPYEFFWMVN